MRTGINIAVLPEDRRRHEALVLCCNKPQKHVWQARIVLLTDDGTGTNAIMRQTGKSKTCVWRWQARFAEAGVDGPVALHVAPDHRSVQHVEGGEQGGGDHAHARIEVRPLPARTDTAVHTCPPLPQIHRGRARETPIGNPARFTSAWLRVWQREAPELARRNGR